MIVVRSGRARNHSRRRSDLEEVYRMLMTGNGHTGRPGRSWRPPIDVYETEDAVEVLAEIAGLDRDEIELVIDEDVLSIRGQRTDRTVCDHRSFHEARIPYGAFSADIFIPARVDADAATASYDNGFLRISLPRSKGRTIVPTSAIAEPAEAAQPEDQDRRDA